MGESSPNLGGCEPWIWCPNAIFSALKSKDVSCLQDARNRHHEYEKLGILSDPSHMKYIINIIIIRYHKYAQLCRMLVQVDKKQFTWPWEEKNLDQTSRTFHMPSCPREYLCIRSAQLAGIDMLHATEWPVPPKQQQMPINLSSLMARSKWFERSLHWKRGCFQHQPCLEIVNHPSCLAMKCCAATSDTPLADCKMLRAKSAIIR